MDYRNTSLDIYINQDFNTDLISEINIAEIQVQSLLLLI